MTPEHKEICLALRKVRPQRETIDAAKMEMLYGKAVEGERIIERHIEWMFRLLYKYRAQLPELYRKHSDNPLCTHLKREK